MYLRMSPFVLIFRGLTFLSVFLVKDQPMFSIEALSREGTAGEVLGILCFGNKGLVWDEFRWKGLSSMAAELGD